MEIRIIDIPPGEAPEHVRAAWVGLTLPAAVAGPRTVEGFGVLSFPKTKLKLLLARLAGRAQHVKGYLVEANRAVQILSISAPESAKWWQDNAAPSLQPGRYFVFHAEVCQEIPS